MLLADTAASLQAGQQAGCHAMHPLVRGGSSRPTWPDAAEVAWHITRLLEPETVVAAAAAANSGTSGMGTEAEQQPAQPAAGAHQHQEQDSEQNVDMVLLVLDAQHAPGGSEDAAGAAAQDKACSATPSLPSSPPADTEQLPSRAVLALEWVDALLRWLNAAQGFREGVLLTLVCTPGSELLGIPPLLQEQPLLQPAGGDFRPQRRPLQSYQAAGLETVAVEATSPSLVVHRLPGVIRCAAGNGAAHLC